MTTLPTPDERPTLTAADLNGWPSPGPKKRLLAIPKEQARLRLGWAQTRMKQLSVARQMIWYAGGGRANEVASLTARIDDSWDEIAAMRAVVRT